MIIEVKNLKYKYSAPMPYVINGMDLSIRPGEKILIAGKNGAGKTTLSKILSGLIPLIEKHGVIEGGCFYEGKPAAECNYGDLRGRIALLFQDFEGQIVSTSVKEELIFYPMNLGKSYRESLGRAGNLAEQFGMQDFLDRNISGLSGGEKQKTAILSLLTAGPEVLILDEPITDLDPHSQEMMLEMVRNFRGTLIVFEQSLDYYGYFDRVIIMKDGLITADAGKEAAGDIKTLGAAGIGAPEVFRAAGGFFPDLKGACAAIGKKFEFDPGKYSAMSADKIETAPAVIQVRDLSFSYPGSGDDVLSGVTFDVKKGEFLAVVGANGSGKTTLMKIIGGIYTDFQRGEILYAGASIKKQGVLGQVGYVYQNPDNQIFAETVFDEIAFALRVRGAAEASVKSKVEAIMETFGLSKNSGADPFSLPKGDREKVACASVLVGEPQVIILDEPTTGLDHPSYMALMDIILELNRKGRTVITITHSMEAAALFGERILALAGGKIVFLGGKREFFRDSAALERANVKRTGIMDASIMLNGNLTLNSREFSACWRKK